MTTDSGTCHDESRLNLAQRIRVLAALNETVVLTMDRETAHGFIQVLEGAQGVDDRYEALVANVRANERRRDRMEVIMLWAAGASFASLASSAMVSLVRAFLQ